MPAQSPRRRATVTVGAKGPTGTSTSHLVLVLQPAADSSPAALPSEDLSPVALAEGDTAQPESLPAGVQAGDRRQAFCAKLRAARERRGILLATIAATTKVSVSHLAALERNDLSRWPVGIYRRAWIRGYAAAVGLPVDATTDEFLAVFDPAPAAPATPAESESRAATGDTLRLTLAAVPTPLWSRLRAHAIDVAIAMLLALIVAWVTESSTWVAIGVLALCAYAPIVAAVKRLATRTTKV